jgi:hypothetical protein
MNVGNNYENGRCIELCFTDSSINQQIMIELQLVVNTAMPVNLQLIRTLMMNYDIKAQRQMYRHDIQTGGHRFCDLSGRRMSRLISKSEPLFHGQY